MTDDDVELVLSLNDDSDEWIKFDDDNDPDEWGAALKDDRLDRLDLGEFDWFDDGLKNCLPLL